MPNKLSRPVAVHFSETAGEFDALASGQGNLAHRVVSRTFRRSMQRRFALTLSRCQPLNGKTFLDVGCGPGRYMIALAAAGAQEVVGIDIASGMIDLARRNLEATGVGDRCHVAVADLLDYSPGRTFDHTIAMGFMDYIDDASAALAKICELTSDSALISFPTSSGFLAWQRRMRYRCKCDLFLYSRDQIETLCRPLRCRSWQIESIGRDFFVTLQIS